MILTADLLCEFSKRIGSVKRDFPIVISSHLGSKIVSTPVSGSVRN